MTIAVIGLVWVSPERCACLMILLMRTNTPRLDASDRCFGRFCCQTVTSLAVIESNASVTKRRQYVTGNLLAVAVNRHALQGSRWAVEQVRVTSLKVTLPALVSTGARVTVARNVRAAWLLWNRFWRKPPLGSRQQTSYRA